MKKTFLVFADKLHEYTITSKEKTDGSIVHTIFHSHGEQWGETTKGTKALRIIEGNLEMEIVGMAKGMQPYCDIAVLKLLLNFITSDYKDDKYKIVEETNTKIIK